MTTVIAHPGDESQVRVFVKGASEVILERCTNVIRADGKVDMLSQDEKAKILKDVIHKFSSKALRAIGFAYKDMSMEDFNSKDLETDEDCDFIENSLTFSAICGIIDPLRPEVVGAVAQCQKSGITVRMVTGDNLETAKAISLEAGIITEGDLTK